MEDKKLKDNGGSQINEIAETEVFGTGSMNKACNKVSEISDYTVKADYDICLHMLPKADGADPDCVHHFKGNIKRNLLCMIATCGIVTGAVAALLGLIHLFCYVMCRKK